MRRSWTTAALINASIVLSGCEQTPTVNREEYDKLKWRVAALESKAAEAAENVKAEPAAAPVVAPPPKPTMNYQLVNSSFKSDAVLQYPTKARCEEARQVLLDNWAAEDERNREKGVIFTSRPTPSCLPIS